MNNLLKLASMRAPRLVLSKASVRSISNSKAACAGSLRDFAPGPYPKTEEERIKAAKKYGMKPEDYKPYPDDGLGFGDYPMLPKVSSDMKSEFEEYDDQTRKRNFGEPYLIEADYYTEDKFSFKEDSMSFKRITILFFASFISFYGIGYLLDPYQIRMPVAPRQYPRDLKPGEKHYEI